MLCFLTSACIFFSKPNKPCSAIATKLIINGSRTLSECRKIHIKETITVTPSMTVADLEQSFSTVYGLDVMVQRKSGKLWLEVTVSDGWTLEEQNSQGESLSKVAV